MALVNTQLTNPELVALCYKVALITRWPNTDFSVHVFEDARRFGTMVQIVFDGRKADCVEEFLDRLELIRVNKTDPIMPKDETIATLMLYLG